MASFDSRYYSHSAERRFFRDSINAPLLSREYEHELATRWRDEKDVSALHEIITAYTRLVISLAPNRLEEVHRALASGLQAPVKVMYQQLTDRRSGQLLPG